VTVLARYAKAVVGFVGMAATYIVATLPPDNTVTKVAAAVLAVLTIFGVAATRNARTMDEARSDVTRAYERAGVTAVEPEAF
jgi:hypothetical protein